MKDKVIVICAIVGNVTTRKEHPGLPITPKEIAESAVEAHEAGAAICHIHVRDPQTGSVSMEFGHYEEVVGRVRAKSKMLINLTTGTGGRIYADKDGNCDVSGFKGAEERVAHVLRLKPELCSLDVGSANFRDYIFANPLPIVEDMAERIKTAGVKPELEVFDLGHISIAKCLIGKGLIQDPPLFQLCMGIPWTIAPTLSNFMAMHQNLPEGTVFFGFGVGRHEFPIVTQCILMGGHIRVGMEDNIYIAKGVLAKSNAELVEKAVKIARNLGKEIASVQEARQILGIA